MSSLDSRFRDFFIFNKHFIFDGYQIKFFEVNDVEAFLKQYESRPQDSTMQLPYDKGMRNELNNVLFNIANTCNIHCQYCFAGGGTYGRKHELMSLQVVQKIIQKLEHYSIIKCVTFFGGEPTLNFKVIRTFVKELKSRTLRFTIISNGYCIEDNILRFFDKHRFLIIISIDGDKRIHNKIRMGFNETKKIIYKITSYPNIDLRLSCQYTPIHMQMGITIKELHYFFKKTFPGVPYFITAVFSDCSNFKFSEKQLEEIKIEKYWEIDQTFAYLTHLQQNEFIYSKAVTKIVEKLIFRKKSLEFCTKCNMQDTLNFDIDGSLYPCHVFFGKEPYKLSEIDSIQENSLLNSKDEIEGCRRCWAKYVCQMCPSSIYILDHLDSVNKQCPEQCEKAHFIETVIKNLLDVYNNPEKYKLFSERFSELYKEIHEV